MGNMNTDLRVLRNCGAALMNKVLKLVFSTLVLCQSVVTLMKG